MIEIGACKVKGKLSSMPSNDYNVTSMLMRDTSAQMSHGSLCQKLMVIKLSKMGVSVR